MTRRVAQFNIVFNPLYDETLIDYVKEGNLDAIENLLHEVTYDKVINKLDKRYGKNGLLVAVEQGRNDIVSFLLKKMDPNVCDRNGNSSLAIACLNDNIEMIELLIKNGGDIYSTNSKGITPLDIACQKNLIKVVECILKYDPNIEKYNKNLETPLAISLRYQNMNIVNLLLDKGALINCIGMNGNTPLTRAVFNNQYDTILFILNHGGDPMICNVNHENALFIACKHNYLALAQLLIQHNNAAVHGIDMCQRSCLMMACMLSRASIEMIQLLCDSQCDLNQTDISKTTALMYLIRNQNITESKLVSTITLLLNYRIDLNLADRSGNTALIYACKLNRFNAALLLVEHAASPFHRNSDNQVAADCIVDSDHKKRFLQRVADSYLSDDDGEEDEAGGGAF